MCPQSRTGNPRFSCCCAGIACVLCVILAGCFSPLSKAVKEQAAPDIPFEKLQADPEAFLGKVVLLGGEIVQTQTAPEGSTIEVLEKSLDRWGSPRETDQSGGRFILTSPDFLDPLVYREGRRITVAGEVQGKKVGKIGDRDYTYPVLKILEIHLWAEPRKYPDAYPYPFPVWSYWYFHGYPFPPWQ